MKLYHVPASPPSRSVLMTIRCLGLDVEIVPIDFLNGQQRSADYLKINPMGQVPVLDDDGFILTESRAIMAYLVNSKKPGSSLYPNNSKQRAIVDSKLYFDASNLFALIFTSMRPLYFKEANEVSAEHRLKFKQVLQHLENFLDGKSYFAGNEPTLADISILSNIAYIKNGFGGIGNWPKLEAWYKRCASLPGYEENLNGAKTVGQILKQIGVKLAPME